MRAPCFNSNSTHSSHPFRQAMCKGNEHGDLFTSGRCRCSNQRANSMWLMPTLFCSKLNPHSSWMARMFSYCDDEREEGKRHIISGCGQSTIDCGILPLRFAAAILLTFASKSLDSLAESRKPFGFCRLYSRTLFHHDSLAMHCPIEIPDSLSRPYFVLYFCFRFRLSTQFNLQSIPALRSHASESNPIESRWRSSATLATHALTHTRASLRSLQIHFYLIFFLFLLQFDLFLAIRSITLLHLNRNQLILCDVKK